MTSSQPPQPPLGGQPPGAGQQPPPGYGQQPPPGYGRSAAGYGQQPRPAAAARVRAAAAPGTAAAASRATARRPATASPGRPVRPARGQRCRRLVRRQEADDGVLRHRRRHRALPDPRASSRGTSSLRVRRAGVDFSVSGLSGSGNVKTAFFLFLLATVWALLPAFTDLKLGFPRVAGSRWVWSRSAWVLTLFAWIDTFDVDFSVWALLGIPDGHGDPGVRGARAAAGAAQPPGAARWAGERRAVGQPARARTRGQRSGGQPGQPQAAAAAAYGQPSYGQPTGGPPPHAAAAARSSTARPRRRLAAVGSGPILRAAAG